MRLVLLGLMLLGSPGAAQTENQITLKYDDGSGVTGELVEYTDEFFRIEASVGLIAIPTGEVSCIGAACPSGTKLEVPSAPATLTGLDGTFSVTGTIIDYADDVYVVATAVGEMRVDARLATCEGAGCVDITPVANQTVMLISDTARIEGKLLAFEDGNYVIDIEQFGELRLNSSAFECLGDACP
ncbi:MAG: hypothetical protein AAFQ33_11565 [Pseudomonadota bacterium]